MKKLPVIPLALCFCALLSSCSVQEGKEELHRQVAEHKARNLANWRYLQGKPLADRVLPAPDLLLDYLRLDNRLNGYDGVPKAPTDWRSFAADVQAVVAAWPAAVQKHLRNHVLGIFLVTDLGSTALSDVLIDFPRHHTGFTVLDVSALDRPANAWATWREKTPFKDSEDIQITVRIADDRHDDRKQAISYILLHELGHLVGAAAMAHPFWETSGDPSDYPFSTLCWGLQDGGMVSRWDHDFQDRSAVRFYAKEELRLPAAEALPIYRRLLRTDFVSLYGATSAYEDFAETYAMYVHVLMQNRPWIGTVKAQGSVLEWTAPISDRRCQEKRQYVSGLMAE